MASAKKLPSGSWRCLVYDYTDANNKRHYESFTADTKKKAEYLAAEYALNKKEEKKNSYESISLLDASAKYIASRSSILSPASIREYKRMRNNSITPIANYKVSELSQEIIQEYVNNLSYTLSPKSVRCIHGFISSVLRQYRPDFSLNTILPKSIRPKIYVPSDEDIKRLINHVANTEMELPVLLAAFGSMRRGEICAFTNEDIHGNTIHVNKTMVLDENKKWVIKAPKSYAGDRMITFPEYVAVKINPVNLCPEQITKKFAHVLHSAGLPHFRFHDLRHP